MIFNSPSTLVKYIRDGLVEEQHFGYILHTNNKNIITKVGESNNYPFYLRSCAKPLQAALIIDYGMNKYFNLSEEELALCCASHAGEEIHTNLAEKLLKKLGLDNSYLKCGLHEPLSLSRRKTMLINNEQINTLHNNCSGKHIMMLGLCVMNDWDLNTYDEINHPLQIAIKNKIYQLCEIKEEYPQTTDGCGVPIYSMPLLNMCKGYLNLFCSDKYKNITNAFLNHPYIIGGENRTDTKIIENSNNLVAKVGAGGLCIIVNVQKQECLLIKISDCNMEAREAVVIDYLKKLNWAEIPFDYSIKTLNGKSVGEIALQY